MQADEFVEAVRNHYVPQLSDFINLQRLKLVRGAGEVKFRSGSGSRYYRDFVCIDFAAGGQDPQYVEFGLDQMADLLATDYEYRQDLDVADREHALG